MKVEIGALGLKNKAARDIRNAKDAGLELESEQALMLEFVGGFGHEYGHAIKRGLDNQGISSEERAKNLGLLRQLTELGIDPLNIDAIYDERLACSFERLVKALFLKKLGFQKDQVESILGQDDARLRDVTEATYSLYEYLGQKGYTAEDVGNLELEVLNGVNTLGGYSEDMFIWRTHLLLEYANVPYSEDQVRQLVTREKAA